MVASEGTKPQPGRVSHPRMSLAARLALRAEDSSLSLESTAESQRIEGLCGSDFEPCVEAIESDVNHRQLDCKHAAGQTSICHVDGDGHDLVSDAITSIRSVRACPHFRLYAPQFVFICLGEHPCEQSFAQARRRLEAQSRLNSKSTASECSTTTGQSESSPIDKIEDDLTVFEELEASILPHLQMLATAAEQSKLDLNDSVTEIGDANRVDYGRSLVTQSVLRNPRKPRLSSLVDGELLSDNRTAPATANISVLRVAMQLKRKAAERRQSTNKPGLNRR